MFYKFGLSLEMQTRKKLALNTDIFSQLNDYQGWEEFWPQCLCKISNKNIQKLTELLLIFVTSYILEMISDCFENMFPNVYNFHDYFPHDFGGIIDIFYIIFIQKVCLKLFSDYVIFVLLPKLCQFIYKPPQINPSIRITNRRPFYNMYTALLKEKRF
jgi:hypothetical protein